MKQIGIWISLFVCCSFASAEMRIWQDKTGKRFKAEFQQELFGDVVLKTDGQRTRTVKLDDLSAKDRDYIYDNIQPEIDISFSKKTRHRPEMEWTIEGDVTTLYTCTVKLKKTSELPYTGRLTAELFLLATEVDGDNYILIHREKSEFAFPEGKNSSYEFVTVDIPVRRYYCSWANVESRYRGADYLGYVISVSDAHGQLVASKTDVKDSDWLTDDMAASIEGLRQLAINGRGSVYSRHFDTTFEKVMVPRIPWYKRDSWF